MGRVGLDGLVVPAGSRLLRDPFDSRLGGLPEGGAALLGVPWDWATSGRPGAREAPLRIRRVLYGLAVHSPSLGSLAVRPVDYGDLRVVPGGFEATMGRLEEAAYRLFERHGFTMFLGGDHSITEAIVSGLARLYGRVCLLVLDAHYDMRSVEEGLTSGMWLWRLHERLRDRLVAAIVGIGEYANPSYLARRAEEAGFLTVPALEVLRDPKAGLDAVEWLSRKECDAYYVSIDVDHIDQAYAPGVNSPNPLGLRPEHTLQILYWAQKLNPRGADIVEVVPQADPTGSTVRLAALIAATTIHLYSNSLI